MGTWRKRLLTGGGIRVVLIAVLPALLLLGGCNSSDSVVPQTIIEANINSVVEQEGGGTTAVASYTDDGGTQWAFYNMANRFAATPIGMTKGSVYEITVPGMVRHATLVNFQGAEYALLSMGDKGIGVVNVTDPEAMSLVGTVTVNYEQSGISYAEGGGDIVSDVTISGTDGPVTDMVTDGNDLWIADSAYGIHETALSNLLPTPKLEADGTLKIDNEVYTLQYAGENPWGGPQSLKLYDGKLYAALGFIGIGIYNPSTLAREGGYNMYADTSVTEDWFGSMDPSQEVNVPDGIDPVTGAPTYQEASYEIKEIWHNDQPGATPWADFDRYAGYYYDARAVALATVAQGTQNQVIAYIAYSLGGLVAVDVTNPASPHYLGYVPAVPAHGPDEPTGQQSQSLFPHFGSGMLKEAGVTDVRVAGGKAYYSDHFAGLVVVGGADDPAANWHGPDGKGNYNNDTMPNTPFWPDYEFVTSYDMAPYDPNEEESLPTFLYQAPIDLATGEISGHGGAMLLTQGMDSSTPGQVDVVQADGAGGVNFIDITDLNPTTPMSERFTVPAQFVSTNEVGADVDGVADQSIQIGHTAGVTTAGHYLYVSDGPHGMSVWRIADDQGNPLDDIHLVANTLQDEYPEVNALGETILPTPHAYATVFGANPSQAYVLAQSLGLRRVNVSAVTGSNPTARVGAPALLKPLPSGVFEHGTDGGSVGGIKGQDHAYDEAFTGHYAVVADGSNGLTVYNISADPTDGTDAYIVANIGSSKSKPALGRATAVALWTNPANNRKYAIVAAGSSGISVVDMTDLLNKGITPGMTLVKTFQPIKIEEEDEGDIHVGDADAKSVDVKIVGNYAYFSYDSYGLVAYKLSDLVAPLPSGVDPTELYNRNTGVDYRPVAVGRFDLSEVPGYETVGGGAQYMTAQYFPAHVPIRNAAGNVYTLNNPRVLLYVAYDDGGVIKLDWSDPAAPKLLEYHDTVGEATDTAIANGRVYVADGDGGLVVFR